MGRGDKKSKKGKIFKGSYGVVRPKKTSSSIVFTSTKKKTQTQKATSTKKKTTKKK